MVTLDQAGRGARWTRIEQPDRSLGRFVEFLWLQRGPGPDQSVAGWRIVADTRPHLIVSRDRDQASRLRTRVSVIGARSRWVDGDLRRREWVAGARLRTGVLPMLTGLPASDFTDRAVPVDDVLSRGSGLLERLDAASHAADATRVLARFLSTELEGRPDPGGRIPSIPAPSPGTAPPKVRDLAARAGTGERSLRRLYQDAVGLSPVVALRIDRLHRALGLALGGAGGWARIAALSGYCDQPHMIHDFQALLGESPERFVGRRSAAA